MIDIKILRGDLGSETKGQFELKCQVEVLNLDQPKVFQNIKIVIAESAESSPIYNILEELKKVQQENVNNPAFMAEKQVKTSLFHWVASLFQSKILSSTSSIEKEKRITVIEIDSFTSQIFHNQLTFLKNKSNILQNSGAIKQLLLFNLFSHFSQQQSQLSFIQKLTQIFQLSISTSPEFKDGILEVLNEYDGHLFENPFWMLLSSVEQGQLDFQLKDVKKIHPDIIEYWTFVSNQFENTFAIQQDTQILLDLWNGLQQTEISVIFPDRVNIVLELSR